MMAPVRLAGAVLGICVGASVLAVTFLQHEADQPHEKLYEQVVESVVAVRGMAVLGERSGTGIVLSKEGLILTSYCVIPEDASDIRVYTSHPRLYQAQIVAASKTDEVTLLKIEPVAPLKPMSWGLSSKVKIGQAAYTIGNANNSMINDGQAALNFGIVSGFYNLRKPRVNAFYTGHVFETTAAVNEHMEGAPLLNADGEVIGMVTLNFSPHRFLGNAIPSDVIRSRTELLVKQSAPPEEAIKPVEGTATLGMTVRFDAGAVVVHQVEPNGPADREGLRPGDVLETIGTKKIQTVADYEQAVKNLTPGSRVIVRIRGFAEEIRLEVGGRK